METQSLVNNNFEVPVMWRNIVTKPQPETRSEPPYDISVPLRNVVGRRLCSCG